MQIKFRVSKDKDCYTIIGLIMSNRLFAQYKNIPWQLGGDVSRNRMKNAFKVEFTEELLNKYNGKSHYFNSCIQFKTIKEARYFIKDFIEPNILANILADIYKGWEK